MLAVMFLPSLFFLLLNSHYSSATTPTVSVFNIKQTVLDGWDAETTFTLKGHRTDGEDAMKQIEKGQFSIHFVGRRPDVPSTEDIQTITFSGTEIRTNATLARAAETSQIGFDLKNEPFEIVLTMKENGCVNIVIKSQGKEKTECMPWERFSAVGQSRVWEHIETVEVTGHVGISSQVLYPGSYRDGLGSFKEAVTIPTTLESVSQVPMKSHVVVQGAQIRAFRMAVKDIHTSSFFQFKGVSPNRLHVPLWFYLSDGKGNSIEASFAETCPYNPCFSPPRKLHFRRHLIGGKWHDWIGKARHGTELRADRHEYVFTPSIDGRFEKEFFSSGNEFFITFTMKAERTVTIRVGSVELFEGEAPFTASEIAEVGFYSNSLLRRSEDDTATLKAIEYGSA